jgi:hypothetical protein
MDAPGHVGSPLRTPRLADRLAAARRTCFVGRQTELDLFRSALLDDASPFAVLYVHAPGGVGKTALLAEYAHIAAEVGVPAVLLDGRNIDPSPPSFLRALSVTLGIAEGDSPLEALARQSRGVLLIDTYETLAPLDAWLRESFLPQLPERHVVVVAGRNPPAPAWRSDLGWPELVRIVPLRNLRPDESRVYLGARGVPDAQHEGVLAFTHGHPLALALVSDVLARGDTRASFLPEHEPDVVQALLERFVQQIPSQRHRDALEVCAHARVTTEPLLAEVLGDERAAELFAWLRGLSFIEQGPQGLFPHDLAREVLDTDLRWRNPEDYRELHGRVRRFVVRTLQEATGHEQQRAAFDLLYLHRGNPIVRPMHDWDALTAGYAEPATPADIPTMLALVHGHEGPASAEIAAYWAARQLQGFAVCRDEAGEVAGFVAVVTLHRATPEDRAADPAIAAAWDFAARSGPVRPGEEVIYHRFQMGRDTYQTASAAMNLMAMNCALHWVTNPRLAWSFLAVADPDYWQQVFTYVRLRRSPVAEFSVGGRPYAVYTHDWRAEPAPVWLDLMSKKELTTDIEVEALETRRPRPLVVLSEPEFATFVRQALRDYTRPDALATNPLVHSRLTLETADGAPDATTLQARIREAAEQLRANPRDEKLYRAIHRTYLEPAASQELAAERLGLPFSSYRRHLTAGIARITASLWWRELHGLAT